MSRQDRAKQFMPFAALKGLPEALKKKERLTVERIELSDCMKEELNEKFLQLETGKMATVTYYLQGEYVKLTGMVAKIDCCYRVLRIVDVGIHFDDIIDIEFH
jgi:uncharacterized protein YpbB